MISEITKELNNRKIKGIVKIEENFTNSRVLFKMYYPDTIETSYYIPDRVFKNPVDVINHITDNLETDGLKIIVKPLNNDRKNTY
jgi:hypothetical protein